MSNKFYVIKNIFNKFSTITLIEISLYKKVTKNKLKITLQKKPVELTDFLTK